MKNRIFLHKLMTVFTIAVMMAVQIPLTGFAEGEQTEPSAEPVAAPVSLFADGAAADLPTIHIDYLGDGAAPADTAQKKPKYTDASLVDTEGRPKNVIFWIGVAVDRLPEVGTARDDFSGGVKLAEKGLSGVEIGFDYNPEYVEPCGIDYTDGQTDDQKNAGWLTSVTGNNLAAGETSSATVWDSDTYEIKNSYRTTASDTNPDNRREEDVPAGWKMTFVSIQRKEGIAETSNRFLGTAVNDKQYLLRIPFRLVKAPAAGTAEEDLPIVFKLSRGSGTLAFQYGDGNSATAWRKDDPFPALGASNLKNLFDFAGDFNIFVGEDLSLSDFKVTSTADDGSGPVKTTHDLYDDDTFATPIPTFDPTDAGPYYVRVPHTVDKITLELTGDGLGDATAEYTDKDGNPQTATVSQPDPISEPALWATTEIPLVDTATDKPYNEIVLKTGGVEYTIRVQKLLEAKIVLNYGNSPYGEIMNQEGWTDDYKKEAKEKFNEKNRYVTDYTPDNVPSTAKGMTSGGFGLRAWGDVKDVNAPTEDELTAVADPEVNMDRNDYAIFVYDDAEAFVDPGFTAKDSLGNDVAVTRTITIETTEKKDSFTNGVSTPLDVTITGDAKTPITKITNPEDGSYVRVGKYKMTYTAKDYDDTPITPVERYVVILHRLGDTDFSREVGGLDFNPIYLAIADETNYLTEPDSETGKIVDPIARRLYVYRTLDTDFSGAIGGLDFNSIYIAIGIGGLPGIEGLYRELPKSVSP